MKRCPQCQLFCTDEAQRCDCGHVFEGEDGMGDAALEPLEKEVRQGARWFYWIAGLSVVNAVFSLLGTRIFFFIGLGVNEFVRAFYAGLFGVPVPNLEFEPALIPAMVIESLIALSVAGLGYAASRGVGVAFIAGAAVYAFDAMLCLMDSRFIDLAFHGLALLFILKGYLALQKLRRATVAAAKTGPSVRRPLFLYGLVAAPLFIFAPILVLLGVTFFFLSQNDMIESTVLSRAPEDFTAVDRERLHRAYAAVADRFERDGGVSQEEAARMNEATVRLTNKSAGELATREELLELVEILESIGRVSGGATVLEDHAYHFSFPPSWSVRNHLEDATASEVLLDYRDQATIGLRVDSLDDDIDARVARSPDRLADVLKIEGCQQEWTISDWGSYKGHGQVYQCARADETVRFKFFASSLGDDRYLEHYQVFTPEAETPVYEAEYLVLQTLEIVR